MSVLLVVLSSAHSPAWNAFRAASSSDASAVNVPLADVHVTCPCKWHAQSYNHAERGREALLLPCLSFRAALPSHISVKNGSTLQSAPWKYFGML